MSLNHLQQLRCEVERGFVIEQCCDDLSLFKYHAKCMFEQNWNATVRKARGIILNNQTGEIICRPFDKFFNVDELPETTREKIEIQLANCRYEITDKLDGSLICLWYYNNKWHTSTTGSMNSKQSEYAFAMLQKYYPKFVELSPSHTYLFEMVGVDWDCKVVKYNKEELVLLTAFLNDWVEKEECCSTLDVIAKGCGFGRPRIIECSLIDAIDRKYIDNNSEGYVVHFFNKKRIKIKSLEYLRLHRIIGKLTSRNLIAAINSNDLMAFDNLPEHLQQRFDDIYAIIMQVKYKVMKDVEQGWKIIEPAMRVSMPIDFKRCALLIKEYQPADVQPILFLRLRAKHGEIDKCWKIVKERMKEMQYIGEKDG